MTIGIKIRNSIPHSEVMAKTNRNWHEGGGLGLAPKVTKRFEGTGINQDKYGQGYQRMMGVCKKCRQYKGENAKQGEHCKLERCEK